MLPFEIFLKVIFFTNSLHVTFWLVIVIELHYTVGNDFIYNLQIFFSKVNNGVSISSKTYFLSFKTIAGFHWRSDKLKRQKYSISYMLRAICETFQFTITVALCNVEPAGKVFRIDYQNISLLQTSGLYVLVCVH